MNAQFLKQLAVLLLLQKPQALGYISPFRLLRRTVNTSKRIANKVKTRATSIHVADLYTGEAPVRRTK